MSPEEFEARRVSRTYSLDSSSVKEVDPAAHFQQVHSDDEQIRTPLRSGKMGKEEDEDLLGDASDLEDLIRLGKEELLKTSVLSLKHLSNDRIICLMKFILDIGGHTPQAPEDSRLVPRNMGQMYCSLPGFGLWSKLVSRVKTLVSFRTLMGAPRCFPPGSFSMARSRRLRSGAIQMSDAVAEVLAGHYLRDLQHVALPPCHISTVATALLTGGILTLQHLELQGHSDQSPFVHSRPLACLFMSGLLGKLQHLRLSKCMEEEEAGGLAAALNSGKLPNLTHLDLSLNRFEGPSGSRCLLRLMKCESLVSLSHLNLNNCGISDEGMKALARAIKATGPWKLKYLNLGSNDIGDPGFGGLLNLIKTDQLPQLQELHLLYNYRIGEESKVEAAKILENGHSSQLQVVYLSSHLITERVAEAFLTAYKNNTGLFVELRNVLWPTEVIERGVARFRERNLGLLFSGQKSLHLQQLVPDIGN